MHPRIDMWATRAGWLTILLAALWFAGRSIGIGG
jgi:hypothetical protein